VSGLMGEYRDSANRLSFTLSERSDDFRAFADRMTALHGEAIQKLSGLDQAYWDFEVNGATVVLHADVFAGVSIHVEDGSREGLLREIARELTA